MVTPGSNCRFCGKPITFSQQHTFRGTCESADCRMQLTKDDLSEFKAAEIRRHKKRCDLAAQFAENHLSTHSPSAIPPAVYPVPCMKGELTELPTDRRDQFQKHLKTCVDDVFAEPLNEKPQGEREAEINAQIASPSPIVIAACSTCRGDCCRQGETHAFVTKELIARVRRHHPTASQQEIVEMYNSRLSSMTQEGSCVYHQERGCGLPRELRANICNSFECEDLHYIRLAPPSPNLVMVSLDGEVGVRSQELQWSQPE